MALLHKRIAAFRTPLVLGMVLFVSAHHLLVRKAPWGWHLWSEVLLYGVGGPIAAWVLLGWLAKGVAVAEQAELKRAEAAVNLAQRNRQIEALYTASRLLAGSRSVADMMGPLLDLACRIACADHGALIFHPEGSDEPLVVSTDDGELAFQPKSRALCLSCVQAPYCSLPKEVRCLPILAGSEVLGVLRLQGGQFDATTDHSLDTLLNEITTTWWARRAEGRALSAFRKIGSSFRNQGHLERALEQFVDLLCEALGASAGAVYRLGQDGFMLKGRGGQGQVPPPEMLKQQNNSIWTENNGRLAFVLTEEGSLVALEFTSADSLPIRDLRLLRIVASQADFLLQITEASSSLVWQERQRLAGELHDGLAQTLAYLHLQMRRTQEASQDKKREAVDKSMIELSQVTLEAYEDVRKTIDDLRLYPRTGELASSFLQRLAMLGAAREDIAIDVNLPEDFDAPQAVVIQLARLLQEALTNAIRHGKARRIIIALSCEGNDRVFSISDDGLGFDPGGVPVQGHHGLRVMRERVEGLGGSFELFSQPGQGTTIRARFAEQLLVVKHPLVADRALLS